MIKSANLNRKPRGSLVPSQSVKESHFLGVNQGCVSLPTLQYAHQSSHFSKACRARTSISRCLISLGKLFINSNFLPIELLNNNSHGLSSPPGGLVSPSGGFVSLLCDQGLHFASIKLCQASWM